MFFKPAEAVEFAKSDRLVETMRQVAGFSFDHGLLGEGAKDPGTVGMAFPNGKTLGSKDNIKLRFDAAYMGMAAEGKL
jgi:NitT/TauT family transport system substrate-binding protein